MGGQRNAPNVHKNILRQDTVYLISSPTPVSNDIPHLQMRINKMKYITVNRVNKESFTGPYVSPKVDSLSILHTIPKVILKDKRGLNDTPPNIGINTSWSTLKQMMISNVAMCEYVHSEFPFLNDTILATTLPNKEIFNLLAVLTPRPPSFLGVFKLTIISSY